MRASSGRRWLAVFSKYFFVKGDQPQIVRIGVFKLFLLQAIGMLHRRTCSCQSANSTPAKHSDRDAACRRNVGVRWAMLRIMSAGASLLHTVRLLATAHTFTHCSFVVRHVMCVLRYHSCFDCHAVVYCSPRCRATNRVQHQVECFGMKTQVLALLDARLLLRLTTAGLRWLANEFAVEQQWKQQQPHKSGRYVYLYKMHWHSMHA